MSEWGRPESPGERIEIELTPVEPRRDKARVEAPPATAPPVHEPGPATAITTHEGYDDDQVPRRTLIVTAVAVGLAALGIGWVVGRSDDDATADETPTPTTMAVTTTEPITDTIAPPPTTVRPRPSTTTTTTLPAGTPVDILIAPELRALPYEIAVSTYEGDLYRIALASSTMRSYTGMRDGESYLAFSTAGDLLEFTPWNAAAIRAIPLDGSPNRLSPGVDEFRSHQVVVDGVGAVWVVTADDLATTVPGTGAERAVVQLPAGVSERGGAIGDPAGGLLANASGDVFDINASGSTRLTTGEIVALGAHTAIVSECAEALVCGHVIIDRATGARQPFPLQAIVDQASPPLARNDPDVRTTINHGGYWPVQASIAGTTAVFGINTSDASTNFSGGLAIIDIAQQRVVGVLADTYGPVALSDDGQWVFSAGNGTGLVAFEVATGNTFQLGHATTQGFNSIVVRTI